MIQPLTVRGVMLGEGTARIIVPIVGRTRGDILDKAAGLSSLPVDLVEWRADFYDALTDEAALLGTLRALRETLGELPLLFTVHTTREGGEAALDPAAYATPVLTAARSGYVDLVDVELSVGDDAARTLIDGVHAAGCRVVGSRHAACATPPQAEMLAHLRRAQALGADIPKLAVMPRSDADVLALLSASVAWREDGADRPFITIAMGPRGVVSRVACALTGSCMTFGAAGQTSAPGQLPAQELRAILDAMQSK